MPRSLQFQLLCTLLRPAVKFCLRSGMHIQDVLEAAKWSFVDVAEHDLEFRQEKSNISRLSASTGIHRRDIMRLTTENAPRESQQGLVSRILGQWQHDERFTSRGKPKPLNIEGDDSEFRRLAQSVSQDLNPGTLLFELERLGAVKRKGKTVELLAHAYVPQKDTRECYRLLSRDIEYLTAAVTENLGADRNDANLHATTEFDNIREDSLPKLRRWLLVEGSKFHERVRKHLAAFDIDITPADKRVRGGKKIVFTTYSLASEGKH